MKEELKNIKHAITLLQKAVAGLEGRLAVDTEKKQSDHTYKCRPRNKYFAVSYYQEKEYRFDFDEWWDHYRANGWKVGRNPMKDWHACMAQWEARHKKANPTRTKVQLDARGRPIRNEAGNLLL